jgi:hypothetical protein
VELAVATGTGPMHWQAALDHDPRLLATAVKVINDNARRRR